ncbi:GGDEF domain-containing protein [Geodermatophilus sp. DSM 45219]|uniref:GGDEF domain-containing protein n=1 Tax=Geodermatophilus sp. DSM 45219 TaxID=1881103 RepID=UPI00088ECBF8|nr:GGDEF domain-containing protein [Geodermatophilus sp. DSM 45219]SDO46544.1 diguanylate cyclase (GGDEF) domain-containing protein [Geodermatophilus sp. DSM 45219]
MPLIDEDGFVLGSLGEFDDEPRAFSMREQDLLKNRVRLVRSVLSLRRQVAWNRWDAGMLAALGRTLEGVAAGLPLEQMLDVLTASVAELGADADADQERRLQETVDRLTAVAIKTDGWRQALLRSARQDPLTGLANRSHLLDRGRPALAAGGAVLFVDVDRFKEVNDRGGHAVGDQLLVRLTDRLRRYVERELLGAVVGRLGGDEFVAVLPGCPPLRRRPSGTGWPLCWWTRSRWDDGRCGCRPPSGWRWPRLGRRWTRCSRWQTGRCTAPRNEAAASCTWWGPSGRRSRSAGAAAGLSSPCTRHCIVTAAGEPDSRATWPTPPSWHNGTSPTTSP